MKDNLKPLLALWTKEEREMLKSIQEAKGLESEMAVLRDYVIREYGKLVRQGKIDTVSNREQQ